MSAEVAVSEGARREMEALCSELHLLTPGEAGAVESSGVASTSPARTPLLTTSQDLLLAEASMPGEGVHAEGNNVEIFIEAVAGNMVLSNPASATGIGCREGPMAVSEGRVCRWGEGAMRALCRMTGSCSAVRRDQAETSTPDCCPQYASHLGSVWACPARNWALHPCVPQRPYGTDLVIVVTWMVLSPLLWEVP